MFYTQKNSLGSTYRICSIFDCYLLNPYRLLYSTKGLLKKKFPIKIVHTPIKRGSNSREGGLLSTKKQQLKPHYRSEFQDENLYLSMWRRCITDNVFNNKVRNNMLVAVKGPILTTGDTNYEHNSNYLIVLVGFGIHKENNLFLCIKKSFQYSV